MGQNRVFLRVRIECMNFSNLPEYQKKRLYEPVSRSKRDPSLSLVGTHTHNIRHIHYRKFATNPRDYALSLETRQALP